jgi:hypothetical protein
MVSERLQLVTTRSGLPSVEVDGAAYHSPYDPRREAEKFYAGLRIEEADILLHFGWGLGYSGEVLKRRAKPDAEIVVFEPDDDLFRLSSADPANRKVFEDPRFQFITGSNVCHFFDEWSRLECQETDQILWIEWPAALRQHASLAEALRQQLRKTLRDRAANLLTHFRNGELYFRNAMANFDYQSDADAGRLFGRFKKIPLVIVSAGPSLDRTVRQLKGFEDRCFILAVDTALRPVLAAGITPHAVVLADPTELNARHIVGAMPESTYLIAEQAAHPSALQSAQRRFLFGLGLFPDSLFTKFGFAKSRIDAWGSVATSALDLACRMGADPIIFTGQDFAYTGNRNYAQHTIFHDKRFDIELARKVTSTDIWGNEIYTTEDFIAYRDYFIRRMKQSPRVRFINATEGGILGTGVEILPLREALQKTATQTVNATTLLTACYRPSNVSKDALSHLLEALETRKTNCDCLNGFLELTAKEHLLNKNRLEIDNKIEWGARFIEGILRGPDRYV